MKWAEQHSVTRISTKPLTAEEETRSVAADVLCVWKRYHAGPKRKGGKVLRGYLEAIALDPSLENLAKLQQKAHVYSGDYPALITAPRGYDRYLKKARAHRQAFNALVK